MSIPPRFWRPLRLVLVTETFPPEVNGVARTLGRWVDTFRARGHEVTLIRPRQPGEKLLTEHVHGLPLPFYPQMRFGVASPIRLAERLDRACPDLIHIATEGPLGLAALVAASSLNIPVASSFHTNYDHYLSHYGMGVFESLTLAYLRWFHNQTRVTLVPSQSTRQRLERDGVQRVEIWSRGVDGKAFNPAHRDEAFRQSLGLRPDDVLLLFVGRIASEKNLPALLQAYSRIRTDQIRLALVGDGPQLPQLQTQNTPGLILPGQQQGRDLARWYASADIFAFPSRSETFGNVVLEAQASGLPVVAFDDQAMNERITPGVDGLLVPSQGDLAESLRTLCQDPTRRRMLGRAARLKAEEQTWKAIFDDLEERYLHLIDDFDENFTEQLTNGTASEEELLIVADA